MQYDTGTHEPDPAWDGTMPWGRRKRSSAGSEGPRAGVGSGDGARADNVTAEPPFLCEMQRATAVMGDSGHGSPGTHGPRATAWLGNAAARSAAPWLRRDCTGSVLGAYWEHGVPSFLRQAQAWACQGGFGQAGAGRGDTRSVRWMLALMDVLQGWSGATKLGLLQGRTAGSAKLEGGQGGSCGQGGPSPGT